MKVTRTKLFIAISSLALLIVLIIQVGWIFETARIKEEIFNEKANMVLSKTAEALSSDVQACRNFDDSAGQGEIKKTDSLFNNYMAFYDLPLKYSFEVCSPGSAPSVAKTNVYRKVLEEDVSRNGLELNLFLPGKKHFILDQMRSMFITSMILIIIVLVLSWRTFLTLIREKRISEHTNDFLNNMTHEFKTPLTNIALAGKMILKDVSQGRDENISHYSGIILDENEKLRMQIDQVLSMTALERGEIPPRNSEINLHRLLKECIRHFTIQIESKNGTLESALYASNILVKGDVAQLKNAISNLIDNSIKYSDSSPEILIQTTDCSNGVKVMFTDKGIGIAPEFHEKIFEKYFRVPTGDIHDAKGFGLGLAYIKKIIELHGGEIELISLRNKGSTFILFFPDARKEN